MKTKTLIIGATGKTGLPVVEQAIEAGHEVRAVINRDDDRAENLRALGAEVVQGDLHNLDSVRNLMKGVSKVYFTYPPQLERLVEATTNVAVAARNEGVTTVVNMSQLTSREDARSHLTRQHWLAENVFDWAGVGAIHIRPTYFMQNLLLFCSQSIAEEGKIYLPYGTSRHAPIAAKDIARVIVQLLNDPLPYSGKRLILTGPENFTISEIAEVIGHETGSTIEYVDLPAEQWREILIHKVGLPEFLADHLYNVAIDHQQGVFDKQTDTVEKITGNPPQKLMDFVQEHLPQFQGKEAVFMGV